MNDLASDMRQLFGQIDSTHDRLVKLNKAEAELDQEDQLDTSLDDLTGLNQEEKRQHRELLAMIKNPMKHTITKENLRMIAKLSSDMRVSRLNVSNSKNLSLLS